MLKNSEQIRDEIAELQASGNSIVQLAELEDRELTDDEQQSFDQAIETIAELEKAESQAIKREEFQAKALQAQKLQRKIDNGEIVPDGSNSQESRDFVVPARAKSSRLTVFSDEKDAYVAGHAFLAGVMKNDRSIQFCKDIGLWNTMTESVGGSGGYLIPEEMQRQLVRLREERGVFPRYARNWPMASDNLFVPRDLADTTAYWVGEGVEITAADATVGAAELTAKKLACLTKVSTELDEDSVVDIGELVTRSMAYVMADQIDEAGFNGDGTSTYGGVVGLKNALHSNATYDAASGNTGALTLDLADFEGTLGLLPQYPGISPRWYMHSAVYFASIGRLMNATGGTIGEHLASGTEQRFLGYPVTFTQVLPSTTGASTSTILAYFGDMSLTATLGNRRSVRTQVSMDRYFENDLIGIKATERIAINVHERGDTIRTRPMVCLKTAGS